MTRWIPRAALRLVPARWRNALEIDLAEEANGGRHLWRAWQTVRVAARRLRTAQAGETARRLSAALLSGLAADLHDGVRELLAEPGSSLAIAATLSLGIGATASAYAVFNHLLFRPVPGVHDADRIVTVKFERPNGAHPEFGYSARQAAADLRRAPAFEALAVDYTTHASVLAGDAAGAEFLDVEGIGDGYLRALGVRARIGRLITDDECRAAADVAVISERLWRTHYDSSPSVLGDRLVAGGQPFTIVGVMDAYEGWSGSREGTTAVWIPAGTGQADERVRNMTMSQLVGRLRPGLAPSAAEQELRSIYRRVVAPGDRTARWIPTIHPGLYTVGSDVRAARMLTVYRLAIAATGLLLLLACANAANLLLVRLARRERALMVRSALGAARGRLLRAIIIEAATLAAAAAGAGLAIAAGLVRLMDGMQPFSVGPVLHEVSIDARVLGFAAAAAATTVILFGVVPAFVASCVEPGAVLRGGRSSRTRLRARHGVVAVQLALSLVLVAGAVVLTRSVEYLRGLDPGLDADHVETFTIRPYLAGYEMGRHEALVRRVLGRLTSAPGISDVGVTAPAAFTENRYLKRVSRPGAPDGAAVDAFHATVSGGYFRTLRIPIVAGRVFRDPEYHPDSWWKARVSGRSRLPGVAVLSESLARRLFGRAPAVGRLVTVADQRESPRDVEVIGVVGDTRSGWQYLDRERPAIYEPDDTDIVVDTFYVRSALPPSELDGQVRRVVRDLDPRLPVEDLMTVRKEIDGLFPEDRSIAAMMRLVAALAAALGLAGVAAIVTFTIATRARDLGIRAALGASADRLVGDALKSPAIATGLGSAAGLALFAVCSRILAGRLHGIAALDPATLIVTTAVFVGAVLLAAWIPARRITRVDPMIVLRVE